MIKIIEVKTKKQQRLFVDFVLKMYKDCPYFAPPLYIDELNMFKDSFSYNETCESKFFLCYKNNKLVGRIQGILQKASNNKRKQKRIRFTRFDSIDDQEVANALFDAVFNFAKEKNMEEVVGPLGYSDFEREGLLIEGFEELATFEEQYNYAYYQKLIENYGFVKEVDWEERKIYPPKTIDPKIRAVTDRIIKKHGYKVLEFKSINEVIKGYGKSFFSLINESYDDLYQTVPLLESQYDEIIKGFRLLLSPSYLRIIVDSDNEVACFGLSFPSISKALQKSQGHLTLPAIFRVLKAKKHPEIIDFGLIGVTKKHTSTGAPWLIFREMMEMHNTLGCEYFETNLNLEDNLAIINNWSKFENILHKRRRSFVKRVN